jgi:hypothetical protein
MYLPLFQQQLGAMAAAPLFFKDEMALCKTLA